MRSTPIIFTAALLMALAACSKSEPSTPAAAPASSGESSGQKDSTSLNIDTDKGSVSFDKAEDGDQTSISIGEDKDKK